MSGKLLHGDCLELFDSIPSNSVDMVLCDLPYGTTMCKWDSILPLDELWWHYNRVLKSNGILALTAVQPFSSQLVASNPKIFKYNWVWIKSNSTNFMNVKKQPLRKTEDILIFYKKPGTYNPQGIIPFNKEVRQSIKTTSSVYGNAGILKNNGQNYYQEYTNYPTNVLNFSNDVGLHPTQKPVALFEYLIKTYTNEGETVLDNCAGSGTTAIACLNTNRNYICMEKNKDYFDIMSSRVQKHASRG